jgi:hypothetical protein
MEPERSGQLALRSKMPPASARADSALFIFLIVTTLFPVMLHLHLESASMRVDRRSARTHWVSVRLALIRCVQYPFLTWSAQSVLRAWSSRFPAPQGADMATPEALAQVLRIAAHWPIWPTSRWWRIETATAMTTDWHDGEYDDCRRLVRDYGDGSQSALRARLGRSAAKQRAQSIRAFPKVVWPRHQAR